MELNCITGEITYSEVTAQQLAQQKLDQAEAKAQAKIEKDRQDAKDAVLAKLGLSAAEVQLLLVA